MPTSPARFVAVQLLGWLLVSFLVSSGRLTFWTEIQGATLGQAFGRMILWGLVGAGLSSIVWLLAGRDRQESGVKPARLLAIGALALVLGVVFAYIDQLSDWPLPPRPTDRRGPPLWARSVTPGLSLFGFSAVLLVLDSVERFGREHARALRAEALAAESRLAMLRYELNPHFLFNALNSVIGVIGEDPPRAQQMVRQLSELLRHTLGRRDEATLDDEVRTAERYLAIEQVRFEERLVVEVDVPEALRSRSVPPMIVQPLVENAIKHGMGDGVLTVRVAAALHDGALSVTVANNGRLAEARGGGVGLRNLRDRLKHAHPDAELELAEADGWVTATILLPG